ncbi:MAG: MBL fold metallo-hydrolase [Rhodospirillales bacterium]|nr:MBL fold metallo-hydrolase [Rhodospirillales bacterium]
MTPYPRRRFFLLLILLPLWAGLSLAVAGCGGALKAPPSVFRPDLEYLKALNAGTRPPDPQAIVLLASQYLNANQPAEGAAFFASILEQRGDSLPPPIKSIYLASLGLLRASHANDVPLLQRTAWVNATIDMFEEARRLSGGEIFVVRWMTGIVYARLPASFGKTDAAIRELDWAIANQARAPHGGWLREVYFHLALARRQAGDERAAGDALARSGYTSFDKPEFLTTAYAVSATDGFTFHARRLTEIVPGKVFVLTGFDFTELYFIVSDDGKEMMAVDTGTRPDSARAAYEHFRQEKPGLPPLTAVFITHSHWDHIGGHRFYREIAPGAKFYAHADYAKERDAGVNAPALFEYFFGSKFSGDFIRDFQPDEPVAARKRIVVGGTEIDLIPAPSGETEDNMFIHLPRYGIMFVGDFIMPYIGAPFVEEGSVPGLLAAIDLIVSVNPKTLLHGHEPLTRLYPTPAILADVRPTVDWLHSETLKAIQAKNSRAALHRLNLVPPFILDRPRAQIPYLVMRENIINRLYDQRLGYWQAGPEGLDHLDAGDYGALLRRYLRLPSERIADAVAEMVEAGDYELAVRVVAWASAQEQPSARLADLKLTAYRKLKERYQETNPFKFIIYSESGGGETPRFPPPAGGR